MDDWLSVVPQSLYCPSVLHSQYTRFGRLNTRTKTAIFSSNPLNATQTRTSRKSTYASLAVLALVREVSEAIGRVACCGEGQERECEERRGQHGEESRGRVVGRGEVGVGPCKGWRRVLVSSQDGPPQSQQQSSKQRGASE